MSFNLASAESYVSTIDLRGVPRALVTQDAAADAGPIYDKAKEQAQVVGSGVFSFASGVDVSVREAISDSALLAQLVANKRAPIQTAPLKWFEAYSEVLQNVGWTIQESGWNDYTSKGTAGEVHEKILEVMTAALGPTPAALAIITSTVNALKAMKPDSSWLTIFSREAQKAKIARFQIGLVTNDEKGDVFVHLVGCLIEAESAITQVLFFKWKQAKATFNAQTQKVSINRAALTDLGPAIRTKVRAYQFDYISSITDLEPPKS